MRVNLSNNIELYRNINTRKHANKLNTCTSTSILDKSNLNGCVKLKNKNVGCEAYKDINKGINKNLTDENEEEKNLDDISKNESKVITKPDGSKILLLTTSVGGMKMTVSIKISQSSEGVISYGNNARNNLKTSSRLDKENYILNNIANGIY